MARPAGMTDENCLRLYLDMGEQFSESVLELSPSDFIPRIIQMLREGQVTVTQKVDDNEERVITIPLLRSQNNRIKMLEIVAQYTVSTSEMVGSDMVSTAEHREVSLVMKTDDMYVIGFKNSAGQYYELREGKAFKDIMGGANDLRMNGSYTGANSIGQSSMVTHDVEDPTPDEPNRMTPFPNYLRNRAVLNRENMFRQLNMLFVYKGESKKSDLVAHALIYMVQIFSEAARFTEIKDYIADQWFKPTNELEDDEYDKVEKDSGVRTENVPIARRLPTKLVEIQNSWETMSEEVQLKPPVTGRAHCLGIAKLLEPNKEDEKQGTGSSRKLKGVHTGGSSKKEKQAGKEKGSKSGKGIRIGGRK